MDARALVREILDGAGMSDAVIRERFNPDSPRLIYKISAPRGDLILKGIPDSVDENIIDGNAASHEFLGARGLAPSLCPFPNGERYIRTRGYWFYLFDFIDGELLTESESDMEALGALARHLHSLSGFAKKTWFTGDKSEYYGKYGDRPFKREFDRILDALPDFTRLEQCFIHSDIGPHNAMRRRDGSVNDGLPVVFIDLDDSGIGCRWLDVGFPFIMQFAREDGGVFGYDFASALAFLRGYYGGAAVPRADYDRIWEGAEFMQISYMDVFGENAVDAMWRLLLYGMEQKETLWKMLAPRANQKGAGGAPDA